MNKKVKRNSKDYKARRFFKCSVVLLVMMTTLSIASSLFIKNINNSLTMQIEDLNKEAEVLKTQNPKVIIIDINGSPITLYLVLYEPNGFILSTFSIGSSNLLQCSSIALLPASIAEFHF